MSQQVRLVSAEPVIAKIKRLLVRSDGVNGIRALSRTLGVTEDHSSAAAPVATVVSALAAHNVALTEADVAAVAGYFDRHGAGQMVPTELLTALRSGLSPLRRTLVQRAFYSFAESVDGSIRLADVRERWDAEQHPDVLSGHRSPADVHAEFTAAFSTGTNPDGRVTKQEFEQYFAGLAATVSDDETFRRIIVGCWLREPCDAATTLSATQQLRLTVKGAPLSSLEQTMTRVKHRDAVISVFKKHRQHMLTSRLGFRDVGRHLRLAAGNTGFLDAETFFTVLDRCRLYVPDSLKAVTAAELETVANGLVDTWLYISHVLEEMPPTRRLMLERLWHCFPTDSRGNTQLSVVQERFQTDNVEELNAFLEAWDARLVPSGLVAFVELVEWFTPLSAMTPGDIAFEDALLNHWKL